MLHDWIPSTLGHGETMCRRCFITNREAAVLRQFTCDTPPKYLGIVEELLSFSQLISKFEKNKPDAP